MLVSRSQLGDEGAGSGQGKSQHLAKVHFMRESLSIYQRLFAPVDARRLAWFRVVFGITAFWQVWMYVSAANAIERLYVNPSFHFTYLGFGWVKPWPGQGIFVLFCVLTLLAILIIVGAYYRFCMAMFCVGFTYLFLIDKALYQNHYYLICLISFLMSFMPANSTFSIDSRRFRKFRATTVPAWTVGLLQFQLGVVYFFGGLAKINPDWLRGEPMRAWLYSGTLHGMPEWALTEGMVWFLTWSGLLFDLLIFPLLLWRRTRIWAYLAAMLFHLGTEWIFDIGVFPWFMIFAVTTLFGFHPRWPRLKDQASSVLRGNEFSMARVGSLSMRQKLVSCLLGLYAAIQILVPLRHHLHDGRPSWNGKGDLFAWRMKLDDKIGKRHDNKLGTIAIFARRTDAIDEFEIESSQVLTNEFQQAAVYRHPDMTLDFVHFLADTYRQRGIRDIEIYVHCHVALNGRRPQPIIDSAIDLAAAPRTFFGPTPWVTDLIEPLQAPMTPEDYRNRDQDQQDQTESTIRADPYDD